MPFRLLSPERTLRDESIRSVSLPTTDGEITILPHHTALVALLVPGVVKIQRENGTEELAVSGGFIEVKEANKGITVLADTAEYEEELDLSSIEAAKQRAENVMKQTALSDEAGFAAAAAALQRELARYKVAVRHRARLGSIPTVDQSRIHHKNNAE